MRDLLDWLARLLAQHQAMADAFESPQGLDLATGLGAIEVA